MLKFSGTQANGVGTQGSQGVKSKQGGPGGGYIIRTLMNPCKEIGQRRKIEVV